MYHLSSSFTSIISFILKQQNIKSKIILFLPLHTHHHLL
nr:MAG TPA: hypothetical protein [Bacteriophage sp.]